MDFLLIYWFSIFSHFSLQLVPPQIGPTCHAYPKIGLTHQKFRTLPNNHYDLDSIVRFPFHRYSNHIHNNYQTREQSKFIQNNTTLVYYNHYSILQARYAYYCLQLQHIICYYLLICFTASDFDSHFTCAKNKNENIRIRICTEHQTIANEESNNLQTRIDMKCHVDKQCD